MESREKLEGLQAARAIAALMVAYFHSYVAIRAVFPEAVWASIPWLKQRGFIGVHLFFAISGYVICLVVSKPGFTHYGFMIKRIFRLYPMFWITMLIVLLLIRRGSYPAQPVGHFLYTMSLLPMQGPSAYDPSWTLQIEIMFYIIGALVVPLGGVIGLAVVLASLSWLGWYLQNPWTYLIISDAYAYFLAGVVVFLARGPLSRLGGVIPLITGCVLISLVRDENFLYMTPLSMAALLTGCLNIKLPWSRAPLRWLVLAGDASYSIYLLHSIVFLLSAIVSAKLAFMLPPWMCEPWRYGSILFCCFVSYGTRRLIEKPFIRLGDGLARSQPSAIATEIA